MPKIALTETFAYLMANFHISVHTIKQLMLLCEGPEWTSKVNQIHDAIEAAEKQQLEGADQQAEEEEEEEEEEGESMEVCPAKYGFVQDLGFVTQPLSADELSWIEHLLKERQIRSDLLKSCVNAEKYQRLTLTFILHDLKLSGDRMRLLYRYLTQVEEKDADFLHKMDLYREKQNPMSLRQWLHFYKAPLQNHSPKLDYSIRTATQKQHGQQIPQAGSSRSLGLSSSSRQGGSNSREQSSMDTYMMGSINTTGDQFFPQYPTTSYNAADAGGSSARGDYSSLDSQAWGARSESLPMIPDQSSYGQTLHISRPQEVHDFAELISQQQRGLHAQQGESRQNRGRWHSSERPGPPSSSSSFGQYSRPDENLQQVQQYHLTDAQRFQEHQAYWASIGGNFGQAPQGDNQETGLPFFPSTGIDPNQTYPSFWLPSYQQGGGGSGGPEYWGGLG